MLSFEAVNKLQSENSQLRREKKELETLFANQVRTNTELFQENKELREELETYRTLVDDAAIETRMLRGKIIDAFYYQSHSHDIHSELEQWLTENDL